MMLRIRRAPVAAGLGVAVVVAVVGTGTFAGWSASSGFRGGDVVAGDLELTTGTTTWRQVTPGVSPGASGTLTTPPPGFLSMPGDVIEVRVPVTTRLQGDNLAARLRVRPGDPEDLGPNVRAGIHIEDADGRQVAPAAGDAPYGELSLAGLTGTDAGRTQQWSVVVVVEVLGDYVWHEGAGQTPTWWDVGDLAVDLDQVRSGSGFTGGGAP